MKTNQTPKTTTITPDGKEAEETDDNRGIVKLKIVKIIKKPRSFRDYF